MKVYIGGYPNNWWRSNEWAERIIARRHGKEFGFEVEEKDYDWVDRAVNRFADFWQDVLNVTINQIVKHRKRKIKVRIDYPDIWAADHTLALIIHPVLVMLKEKKHGSPCVDEEDVPENLRKGDEDMVHERWDWVLDEMIWTFENLAKGDDGHDQYYVPYKEGEELERIYWEKPDGTKHYLLTEDEAKRVGRYDKDLHKKYQDRINNGLRLFGKYYQGLWD